MRKTRGIYQLETEIHRNHVLTFQKLIKSKFSPIFNIHHSKSEQLKTYTFTSYQADSVASLSVIALHQFISYGGDKVVNTRR